VSSNALLANGAKTNATLSSSLAWTPGTFGNTLTARIKKNGTVIATGSAVTASPVTVSGTATVANGDTITVEVEDTGSYPTVYPATINAGTSDYVRCA
jgi:hypothetical protein